MAEVLTCQVEVLDGSTVSIDVGKRANGEVLMTEVFKHLSLEESEYFGLSYLDSKDQVNESLSTVRSLWTPAIMFGANAADEYSHAYYAANSIDHWLDQLKPIRKQVKRNRYSFRFRVKLYPVSPTYLFDEVTRYFLALQIKEDLLNQKLFCSDETLAILSGLIVQSEFGDYDPVDHPGGYLDDFPYLEGKDPDFKQKVASCHQQNHGLLPAECDKRFLDIASRLDRFGMDFHVVQDGQGVKLQLGISAKGVTVFCGDHPFLTALNHFPWVRISAVNFKSKNLLLEMVPTPGQRFVEIIMFACPSKAACKTLWKSCVEHHAFFRTVKTETIKRPSTVNLFRRGSTFRYSGRTQFKVLQDNTKGRRSSKKFERLTSRNSLSRKTI